MRGTPSPTQARRGWPEVFKRSTRTLCSPDRLSRCPTSLLPSRQPDYRLHADRLNARSFRLPPVRPLALPPPGALARPCESTMRSTRQHTLGHPREISTPRTLFTDPRTPHLSNWA